MRCAHLSGAGWAKRWDDPAASASRRAPAAAPVPRLEEQLGELAGETLLALLCGPAVEGGQHAERLLVNEDADDSGRPRRIDAVAQCPHGGEAPGKGARTGHLASAPFGIDVRELRLHLGGPAHRGDDVAAVLEEAAPQLHGGGEERPGIAVRQRAPQAALAGGVVGIGGFLIVPFESGVTAAAPAIAGGLDQGTATSVLASIHSGALAGLQPLSLLSAVGLTILGIAATKAGVARWTAVAIAVGAFGEVAGFATGNKSLLLVMFTVLLVGLAGACASLVPDPARRERPGDVAVQAA